MLAVIEKLLILQDRDRKILRLKDELAHVGPERTGLQTRSAQAAASLDAAKHKGKHLESERKKIELEVESYKQKIEKYSLQQFQTKKNDEFKALGHEIDGCKAAIVKLEDQEIELMEQIEAAQKEVAAANHASSETRRLSEGKLEELAAREENLKKELAELESNRGQLASVVSESVLSRYERLLRNKGENVVVGIEHGVCGGCHMKFPLQLVLSCKREEELVTCPNCARILYYTRDMDMAVAE